MTDLNRHRLEITAAHRADDGALLAGLVRSHGPDAQVRARIGTLAGDLVTAIRSDSQPGLMEVFLAEYGLSTDEGVALMCLAEALLRVPDAETMDDLIEDKIAASEWGRHLGHSSSPLVNASTWALMLTGKVLSEDSDPGIAARLRGIVKRMGEPVIRVAVKRAMKEMGQQFVLGETIAEAISRGQPRADQGFTYSFDMLGEAAMTAADAETYRQAYDAAIDGLAAQCTSQDIRDNPGISIKLSALHPRYEQSQRDRIMAELVPVVLALAIRAKSLGMGLNIDAEEADRLELSLDVIQAVLSSPELAGWEGFGVVVQAYSKRAPAVIDWLYALAEQYDRKIMVRLVKGAYWDTEIKHAQVEGLSGFPVYARKAATDVSYICCAARLLALGDRIYAQFATHNAHSVAAVLDLAGSSRNFEFQRLHGMGETLHDIVHTHYGTRCRIYAPVGAHRDLLAYLVRRLLENGANSSFVNKVVDPAVPVADVVVDPFDVLSEDISVSAQGVTAPADLFMPERVNSQGIDLHDPATLSDLDARRARFRAHAWHKQPVLVRPADPQSTCDITNPADPVDHVGTIGFASRADVDRSLDDARIWEAAPAERRKTLLRAADLYEDHAAEFFALLSREAGKTLPDCVSELREAVDFLRYYAQAARADAPVGKIVCISPWNFPLAIFTGQIGAALAAGCAVIAKPAESTSLVGVRAAEVLHEAGVPREVLQLVPGLGSDIGAALVSDARVDGVCFTGSTATAQRIHRDMARAMAPDAPLVAETGGLNAMIVDSTALPEQAVRDIVVSAFQSAGQRCSALRLLYLQEDVAPHVLDMLKGAMDELRLGAPWEISTDVGPIISDGARADIDHYVAAARSEGRLLKQIATTGAGAFVGPALIQIHGIEGLEREVFGPVLHVATFRAAEIDRVLDAVNQRGYGLTFGLHSRIDDRVQHIISRLRVGNLYVNRNQIGAIVGSQPFGGEGLSGTGPKAGGARYVDRFYKTPAESEAAQPAPDADAKAVQNALDTAVTDTLRVLEHDVLPGPTGESNRLTLHPRGTVLCLGPSREAADRQAGIAGQAGCASVRVVAGAEGPDQVPGCLDPSALRDLQGFAAVAYDGPAEVAQEMRQALAGRDGAILSVVPSAGLRAACTLERHVCVDTTASGGNTALLAASG